MVAVLLGLTAGLCYGAADFCGGLATKRTAMFAVVLIAQFAGLLLLLACLPFFPAHPQATDYLWGAAGGVCGAVGLALLYHALSIGKMGVVSPITAVLAAALPVGVGVIHGDHLAATQTAGIAIALVAIVLISLSFEDNGRREIATEGVKEAIASGILLGCFFLCLAQSHRSAGLHPLVAARIASMGFLFVLALVTRSDLRPRNGTLPLIVLSGTLDMSANALYVLATYHGYLAVAAVLTSLYPASTVFLARVILKERLQMSQKIGVTLALLGVGLIAS